MSDQKINPEELKMPEEQFGVSAPAETTEGVSHLGIIIGVLIALLALILGGLYIWSTMLYIPEPIATPQAQRPTAEENNEPESTNAEADVQISETMSTSDEISAIEADLESTNLDNLDAEMTAIEAELEAGAQ